MYDEQRKIIEFDHTAVIGYIIITPRMVPMCLLTREVLNASLHDAPQYPANPRKLGSEELLRAMK